MKPKTKTYLQQLSFLYLYYRNTRYDTYPLCRIGYEYPPPYDDLEDDCEDREDIIDVFGFYSG